MSVPIRWELANKQITQMVMERPGIEQDAIHSNHQHNPSTNHGYITWESSIGEEYIQI
jgi:hypothetical protein